MVNGHDPSLALAAKAAASPLDASIQDRARSYPDDPLFFRIAYQADEIPEWWSPRRDAELRRFWRTEPLLAGAVYSFTSKMRTLSWTLDGPARQVTRFQKVLAEAEFGAGWGDLMSRVVEDLVCQDKGAFIELLRASPGAASPVLGLAHLDAGQCALTADPAFPVIYYSPRTGQRHKLADYQVLHVASMPSPVERLHGIGFCAVSRALRAAQIMRDIWIYRREKLSSRPQRGVWFVSGTSQAKVDAAINTALEQQDNEGLTRFAKPIVVAMMDTGQALSVEALDFASLPDGFDEETSTTLYVYLLALAFGVDAREFWPATASGATKADALVQAMKARGKGPGDVLSAIERAINWRILPDSLTFRFDFVDDEEDRAKADLESVRIKNVVSLYAPAVGVEGLISRAQAVQMLVDEKIVPPEFLVAPDLTPNVTGDDVEQVETPEQTTANQATISAVPETPPGDGVQDASTLAQRAKELAARYGPRVRYRWPELAAADTAFVAPAPPFFRRKGGSSLGDAATQGAEARDSSAGEENDGSLPDWALPYP